MSIFAKRMRMLTAVVLEKDKDRVVKALLDKGVMEFIHIENVDSGLRGYESDIPRAKVSEIRARVESILKQDDIPTPEIVSDDLKETPVLEFDDIEHELDRLSISIQRIKDQQKKVNEKLNTYEEIEGYLDRDGQYIDLRVGTISGDANALKERLESFLALYDFSKSPYVTLSLSRDKKRVSDTLDKFGWTEVSDPKAQKEGSTRIRKALSDKIGELNKELELFSEKVKEKIEKKKESLVTLWKELRVLELCKHVESYFSYTDHTSLFSGWIPYQESRDVERIINEATGSKAIIEWTDDSEVDRSEVPVAMKSSKFFAPFQHLVENYGTPEYGSINPTPFTMVAYILMFMLMFADVGQGFVLLLIGIIGKLIYARHPEKKDGLISRYLCTLLLYLGPASMVGGVLFGSYFGYSWLPPLWFDYHAVVNGHTVQGYVESIYDILGITIWFGIGVIFVGLILNWINLLRKKRVFDFFLDKYGLVGGWLFALGIYVANGFVKSGYKSFPSSPFLLPLFAIPLIFIFLKVPIGYTINRIRKRGKKEAVGQLIIDTIMEFIVECLEIFSGFLANTLSFMRVAGLGIAHVSLMTAFQDMANLTSMVFLQILIMIVGNTLVIALEGLSAGVQSLRLNYYEFFTKFFSGRGMAFSPVGINSRIKVD